MKPLVFTVVVIVLFSFSPSGKANAFDSDCWNTILSWFISPDVLCEPCTVDQVCLYKEWGGWKCISFEYAGCVKAPGWSSSKRELWCTKPNTYVIYKNGGSIYEFRNRNS
ncbi:uncharacterized protein LOC130668006 [Microplitis mediator]|uniref:uncharacterized protein LOC130668006 n=1 Tax=Microplitis mediator TaxID=375433 RepID=UPI0025523716|nr:uncharacterized protein LOC130668006 [Microplitis mediator]